MIAFTNYAQELNDIHLEDIEDVEVPDFERNIKDKLQHFYDKNHKIGFRLNGKEVLTPTYDRVIGDQNGFIVSKDGKYGYVNHKVEFTYPIAYEDISKHRYNRDVLLLKKNGRYGIGTFHGEVLVPIRYKSIEHFNLEHGSALVTSSANEPYILFNNGKTRPLEFEKIWVYKNGYLVSKNGKSGFVTDFEKGIPMEYDELLFFSSPLKKRENEKIDYRFYGNNCFQFIAKKGEHFGIVSTDNEVLVPIENTSIQYVPEKNVYFLFKGHLKGAYFEKTKASLPTIYDSFDARDSKYVLLFKDLKRGLADRNGNIIFPVEYDGLKIKDNGKAFYLSKDKKCGWINSDGKVIVPLKYSGIETFYEKKYAAFLKVYQEDKVALFDKKGKQITPFQYTNILSFYDMFIAYNGNKMGLLSTSGSIVLPVEYDKIVPTKTKDKKLLLLQKNNRYSFLGFDGKLLTTEDFLSVQYIMDGDLILHPYSKSGNYLLKVESTQNKFGLFDEGKQQLVVPCEYDQILQKIEINQDAYLVVRKGKKTGIINQNNKVIIPFEYHSIQFEKTLFSNQNTSLDQYTFVAQRKGKFGILNLENETLTPFEYTNIERLDYSQIYKAQDKKGYAIIDQNNSVIHPGPFDEVTQFEKKTALVFKDGNMQRLSIDGQLTSTPTPMQPHKGFKTFEEMKTAFVKAMDSEDDQLLEDFAKMISPSPSLLTFIDQNYLSRKPLSHVDIDRVRKQYISKLLTFKYNDWNDEFKHIHFTQVQDFSKYKKGLITNFRGSDHAFGDTRILEKIMRNSYRVNGYWISSYFMHYRFN